jgi:hypothetical protein
MMPQVFSQISLTKGCLEVRTEKVECKDDGFFFSAFGIQAHSPIRFVLNLTFAKPINEELCSHVTESVGILLKSGLNLTRKNVCEHY